MVFAGFYAVCLLDFAAFSLSQLKIMYSSYCRALIYLYALLSFICLYMPTFTTPVCCALMQDSQQRHACCVAQEAGVTSQELISRKISEAAATSSSSTTSQLQAKKTKPAPAGGGAGAKSLRAKSPAVQSPAAKHKKQSSKEGTVCQRASSTAVVKTVASWQLHIIA